jgi:hypothetical protein
MAVVVAPLKSGRTDLILTEARMRCSGDDDDCSSKLSFVSVTVIVPLSTTMIPFISGVVSDVTDF